ncbi:MAG: very short patch repair endonuclease [Chloroflexi bacterium]|nr:very short patch repair endonuclease [Chloroflexota bacterium]
MADRYDAETRSRVMRQVHSTNTSIEIAVRKALHAAGFRFRLHRADLPGKPDVVLPRYRMIVFVHGCFWHGHGCKRAKLPATNTEFWERKRGRNMARDTAAREALTAAGWRVRTVWGCDVPGGVAAVLEELTAERAG